MHAKNYFYSDKEIKNLNSVEVQITIPSGSSESEVISFTTNNKKIIFITNNYHELRQEYFRDDSDEFLKILIDAIFSCKEISLAAKSTWRKWNIYNIELSARRRTKISDKAATAHIHEQIDQCCDYLSNFPMSAKKKYEAMKSNSYIKWIDQ
tara:strand:+ start:674 stop:1129 length:456 start_codon:yes stop_codon:yes gene_type:complete